MPRNTTSSYTWIRTKFQDITILVQLLITNIRSQDIIFGLPWFKDYDPQIDWNMGKITIQKKAKTGWMKYTWDNQARLAETKGKMRVMIWPVKEDKKKARKPKEKKTWPSSSPNWTLPEIAEITEEPQEETSPTMTDEKEISGHLKEEPTEITQVPINILAQIEMANSPLEELWINAKTNISQKLAIQETVRGRSTSSLHGIVLQSSYLDLILSHAPISLIIPVYLCMILSLFHRVLRHSIGSFVY